MSSSALVPETWDCYSHGLIRHFVSLNKPVHHAASKELLPRNQSLLLVTAMLHSFTGPDFQTKNDFSNKESTKDEYRAQDRQHLSHSSTSRKKGLRMIF